MATIAALPSSPPDVAAVLETCPAPARAHAEELRTLILDTAAQLPAVGPLTETLKWGQPAFLTEKTKSGATLRLGWAESGASISLYVHCQTRLVVDWRAHYSDELIFVGNREISIPTEAPLPRSPLKHCVALALTYHSRKASK